MVLSEVVFGLGVLKHGTIAYVFLSMRKLAHILHILALVRLGEQVLIVQCSRFKI